MNLKCAIVDDEPLALDLLESYVRKTPFLELAGTVTALAVTVPLIQAVLATVSGLI